MISQNSCFEEAGDFGFLDMGFFPGRVLDPAALFRLWESLAAIGEKNR